MDSLDPQCKHLISPDYKNFILSLLIVLGILLSYLPQHYRIISLKSSFGISPYFVLLGTTSSSSSLTNVLSQQQSLQDAACCKNVNGFACFAGLLGVLQMATQCFCFFTILALFIAYFPRATSRSSKDSPSYRAALSVAVICITHALAMLIITVVFGLKRPSALQSWSNFCGILAAILSSIQYFPQIYTTLHLRCVGSLSIPMMCIQTPGSLVWAGSLAARLGAKGWSTWGVLIVTASLQGTLLVLGVFFEYLSPNRGHSHQHDKDAETDADAEVDDSAGDRHQDQDQDWRPSEQTPLLQ
ncbi:hypothetical protein EYZ11_001521 [Aspergillus tanneri]|uniref:PQ loop repeat protein n=1 Tax=Aspergillus tanneri TaxID=1220188 RepID=A0A4S3JTH3_9EURO|nr:uncharacterized protein ATNIH1004_007590 [Aspergillus tanneri]KAA8646164.1 hypothetical protein ATNIH1004_007590 [Aspergillus tanneri]THC98970.1 hypothetical protein EYZ11_001521 [Aspergillus tanneri]